ncbi:hypothetical protein TNCT_95861 [Trichonephila clavata]|uniref:Uncharacterized protein n=1 Tax=Trichonephila clavata TaxID=2740835 RepID=A0A8X6HLL5_TRICU|nr:hypothetical protein TNCT_95861 [Trichonephila clavata]
MGELYEYEDILEITARPYTRNPLCRGFSFKKIMIRNTDSSTSKSDSPPALRVGSSQSTDLNIMSGIRLELERCLLKTNVRNATGNL